MDQPEQEQQQPLVGVVAGGGQMRYAPLSYQTVPMVASGTLAIAIPSSTQLPTSKLNTAPMVASADFSSSPYQLAYQQAQHFHHQQLQQQQHQL